MGMNQSARLVNNTSFKTRNRGVLLICFPPATPKIPSSSNSDQPSLIVTQRHVERLKGDYKFRISILNLPQKMEKKKFNIVHFVNSNFFYQLSKRFKCLEEIENCHAPLQSQTEARWPSRKFYLKPQWKLQRKQRQQPQQQPAWYILIQVNELKGDRIEFQIIQARLCSGGSNSQILFDPLLQVHNFEIIVEITQKMNLATSETYYSICMIQFI